MKVKVYFNIIKKCFSIVSMEKENKGLVIGYAHNILLKDCEYKVSCAGRKKVLSERRKNVHAWVTGTIVRKNVLQNNSLSELCFANPEITKYEEKSEVTYNPYKNNSFVFRGNKAKISKSKYCLLAVTSSNDGAKMIAI